MKLASLKDGRDGELVVVDRALGKAVPVPKIAPTLQAALDDWVNIEPYLNEIYGKLNKGECESISFKFEDSAPPLPRAYQWLDGSAYLSHVERVRKARGAELPAHLLDDPLMYQGGSDSFIGAHDPIYAADETWGIDFEAEVAIITDDVNMGASVEHVPSNIKLLMLVNDVSFRNLIPSELAKGFGFINGKPSSAFSPVAVTPDELGATWDRCKLHLPLKVYWNNVLFGQANAGADMQFDFARLIAHAAKTRRLEAGTIIGSGTVSNRDIKGYSCIVEKRVVEIVEKGEATTEFMRYGDTIRMEMCDSEGNSIFGTIEQEVLPDVGYGRNVQSKRGRLD